MAKHEKYDFGRFDFLKVSYPIAAVTVIVVLICVGLIATKGFNYGVDFAGGTEIQVQFSEEVDAGKVREFAAEAGYPNASVQAIGDENEFLIRIGAPEAATEGEAKETTQEDIQNLTSSLNEFFANENPTVRRVDTVGAQVGNELKKNGLLALFYTLLLILIYVGLRFDYQFAPASVFCLFHDAVVTLGIYSLFNLEVNIQTLAAILTIVGYSLNDTIVIFDRIRENMVVYRGKDFAWLANRSINDTLSRTILTSLTTFMTVFVMYIIAGGVIADFALTMMIGIVLGTFSTMYVAIPLVIFFEKFQNSKKTA